MDHSCSSVAVLFITKKKNRLELPKGEVVGKNIFRGDEDDEEDEEYKN